MAFDKIHTDVRVALEKEGWVITDQPMRITTEEGFNLYVDMSAEKMILAEREKMLRSLRSKIFSR